MKNLTAKECFSKAQECINKSTFPKAKNKTKLQKEAEQWNTKGWNILLSK